MLNSFGSTTPLLLVVFVEAVGVCWFYGVSRSIMNDNIHESKTQEIRQTDKQILGFSGCYDLYLYVSEITVPSLRAIGQF